MTGQDIKKDFLNRVDKSYSKFIDDIKLNRVFKRAIHDLGEKKYMGLESQKEYDELRYSVSTERIFKVANNKISIAPLFIESITQNGFILQFRTLGEHNLLPGDSITTSNIVGIQSNPVVNGTLTVTGVPSSKMFEVIFSVISGTHTPNTGKIVHERMISNYVHLFAVKARYEELMDLTIQKTERRTPTLVYFSKRTNLRDGESILISGCQDQVVNGVKYIKQLTDKKYKLYNDSSLLSPVISLGTAVSGGTIKRIFYEYCEPIVPDMKISIYEKAKPDSPKNETADAFIKFYPANIECKEITVDYFSEPRSIDVTDSSIDYELIYPTKLLYRIISEAVIIYTTPSRDQLLEAMERREAQINQ